MKRKRKKGSTEKNSKRRKAVRFVYGDNERKPRNTDPEVRRSKSGKDILLLEKEQIMKTERRDHHGTRQSLR